MLITIGSKIFDDKRNSYEVIEAIGSGGFGMVFRIKKEQDSSTYALKTLPSEYPDEATLNSFILEAQSTLTIRHENVVQYIYFHDGRKFDNLPPYIIMEYANEGTLENLITKNSDNGEFISEKALSEIFSQLTNGMKVINSKLVHRDIKPQNILINNNVCKISDFGLAKFVDESTRTKTFKGWGTSKYIAPEAWRQEKNTVQMDIYSMGIVFFELATLDYPYNIQPNSDLEKVHLFETPKIPNQINTNLSLFWSQIILKMLEKNTATRYKDWDEILEDTENASNQNVKDSIGSMVNIAVQHRIQTDNKAKAEELKRLQKIEKKNELCKLVEYQVFETIIKPLNNFITQFNEQYLGDNKISISNKNSRGGDIISYEILTTSRKRISLAIETITEENSFTRERVQSFTGGYFEKEEVRIPKLKGSEVQSWGYYKVDSGEGYNLVLVKENGDDLYGTWHILTNTNNPLCGNRRYPEPFAFEIKELRKEINMITAMHQYQTSVSTFDEGLLFDLLLRHNT